MNRFREPRTKPDREPKPDYTLYHGEVGEVYDCLVPFKVKTSCPRHSHDLPAGTRFIIHEKTGTKYQYYKNGEDAVRYVIMSFGCFHKILYNALNTRRCKRVEMGDPHQKEPDEPKQLLEEEILEGM